MKRLCLIFTIFIIASSIFSQNFFGKRIVVLEPKVQSFTKDEAWIPLFVQGQVTTNFLNYSGMSVIDRQNVDKVIKEQKLSTTAAYSEENQIEIGNLLAADYIVVISITKKGKSFALDAKINNTTTNEAVGKGYNNPNCPASYLEDGSEINELSYKLLFGLGISTNKIAALHDAEKIEAQKKEIVANTNLAKGLAIEKSGGNIVETLAYYQKAVSDFSGITEAADRLQNLTTNLSSGSIRDEVLNELALYDEWKKIWDDYHKWADENYYATLIYSPSRIKNGKIDYEKETVQLEVPIVVLSECEELNRLYATLYQSYMELGVAGHDIKNWNLDIYRYPPKYSWYNDEYRKYKRWVWKSIPCTIDCSILDDKNNLIGSKKTEENIFCGYHQGSYKAFYISITCEARKITDKFSLKFNIDGVDAQIKIDENKNTELGRVEKVTIPVIEEEGVKKRMSSFSDVERYSGGWYDEDELYYNVPYFLIHGANDVLIDKNRGERTFVFENYNLYDLLEAEYEKQKEAEKMAANPIQYKIDKAAPGSVIEIPEGIFDNTITIDKDITLKSAGVGRTVLLGKGENENVITVSNAQKVTISGFSIRGNNSFGLIFLNSKDVSVEISKSELCGSGTHGISSVENFHGNIYVTDSIVHDNKGIGLGTLGENSTLEATNVKSYKNAYGFVSLNNGKMTLTNCEAYENSYQGVYAGNGGKAVIEGGKFHHNEQNGLCANKAEDDSVGGTIEAKNCECYENGDKNIYEADGAKVIIDKAASQKSTKKTSKKKK